MEFSWDRLVDYLDQNIFVKNRNSTYLFCNTAYASLLGVDPIDIVGKNDYDFFPDEIAEKYRSDDKKIFEGEERVEVTEEIMVEGERRYIRTVKTPLFEKGEVMAVLGIFWDVTDEIRSREEIEEIKEGLNQAQALANIGHWELNLLKNSLYWSDEVYRIFGLEPQEFGATYEAFLKYVHPDDVEKVHAAYNESIAEKSSYHIVHRIVRQDGSVGYVEEHCMHDFDDDDNVLRSIGTVHDITKRIESENELRLAAKVFENTSDGVLITDAEQNILQVNEAFLNISGYDRVEVIGRKPAMFSSGWHDELFYEEMWKAISEKKNWTGEIWDRRKNGELYTSELSISVVTDDEGEITNYVAVTSDITDKREKERQIAQMAYYDALTQLPNRTLFKERLTQRIKVAKRRGEKVGVFFFDLDNFKFINDTMGHLVGDDFLKEVAKRIGGLLRSEDSLSRLGGDEFTAIVDSAEDIAHITTVAQKILNAFNAPFFVNGKEIFSSCSIGISVYPDDGEDFEALIKAADTAMYEVKDSGKNSYQFFTHAMNEKALLRLELENDLRNAISYDELFLTYQPKVDTADCRVYGMEALLRWKHREKGMIWPDQFIPVAEETGLIYQIGLWVADRACRDMVALQELGYDDLTVSINVSSIQLQNDHFVKDMLYAIDRTSCPYEKVELEITESGLMENVEAVMGKLHKINESGVRLAIDDFGTGYSSLNYLKRFPVQTLKIDKSFVLDIDKDLDDRSIIGAIIAMAKSLNLDIVAEGGETAEHIDVLRSMACHNVQGYYFAKPMPFEEFTVYLKQPPSGC